MAKRKVVGGELRPLLTKARFQILDGADFTRCRDAAKIANILPVAQEMGREMLTRVGGSGVVFPLATQELKDAAPQIAQTLKVSLRKYAKAMEPGKTLVVKAFKDTGRLVFWYVEHKKRVFPK